MSAHNNEPAWFFRTSSSVCITPDVRQAELFVSRKEALESLYWWGVRFSDYADGNYPLVEEA